MARLPSIVLTASFVLIGLSRSAFAGVPAVPEPTSLALLAVGFGGVIAAKFFKRK